MARAVIATIGCRRTTRGLQVTDRRGGLKAVHFRHFDVHRTTSKLPTARQAARASRPLAAAVTRWPTFSNSQTRHQLVYRIVFGQQNIEPPPFGLPGVGRYGHGSARPRLHHRTNGCQQLVPANRFAERGGNSRRGPTGRGARRAGRPQHDDAAGQFRYSRVMHRAVSNPSIPGIWQSSRIRRTGSAAPRISRNACKASSPLRAATGRICHLRSVFASTRRLVSLSSTSSAMSPCRSSSGAGTSCGRLSSCRPNRAVKWNALPRPRARLHPDPPAHHPHQPRRNRQPQPRPAELAGHRFVRLPEGLEDGFPLLLGNPDPRVDHREVQRRPALRRLFHLHRGQHLAFRRELDGIAQQVEQHLFQPRRISRAPPPAPRRAPPAPIPAPSGAR